jgi:hypothetical protein
MAESTFNEWCKENDISGFSKAFLILRLGGYSAIEQKGTGEWKAEWDKMVEENTKDKP